MPKAYTGPVAFVQGVHYPAGDDGPDLSRPLRWDPEAGGYRAADDGEPLHNDVNHGRDLEIAPGGES
jgi:hypothetical protein